MIKPTLQIIEEAYDRINNHAFDGKLPKYQIKLTRQIHSNANVNFKVRKYSNGNVVITDKNFFVSSLYVYEDQKHFDDIIAHELIHVKNCEDGNYNDGHGTHFLREMARLKKIGYDIYIKDAPGVTMLSTLPKEKKLKDTYPIIVCVNSEYGGCFILKDQPKRLDKLVETIAKDQLLYGQTEFKISISKTNELAKALKMDRSFKGYRYQTYYKYDTIKSVAEQSIIEVEYKNGIPVK